MRSKCLVIGFHGVGNLGDDLMLKGFSTLFDDYTTVITSSSCGTNWNKCANILKSHRCGGGINLAFLPHGKSFVFKLILSRLYDSLIWVGGSCFTDQAGDGAYRYMEGFKRRNKKIGYIGVGIEELTDSKRIEIFSNILSKADLVTLRDDCSYQRACKLSDNKNIYKTEDLVYLLDEIIQPIEQDDYILIAWRDLGGYYSDDTETKAVQSLINFVVSIEDKYSKIVVFPMGNSVDFSRNDTIYKELKNLLPEKVIDFIVCFDVDTRVKAIKKAKLVITGRLHAAFIAEWNNIKTIAIDYSRKVNSFLLSVGKEEDGITPDKITINSLMDIYYTVSQVKLNEVEWLKRHKQAEQNIKLLNKLIAT